jgi:hypothetical protein
MFIGLYVVFANVFQHLLCEFSFGKSSRIAAYYAFAFAPKTTALVLLVRNDFL